MDNTTEIEKQAEQKVAAWRESKSDTNALKQDLLTRIRTKTFNSAVLMRLLAEVLLGENNIVEALAAFNTYVSNQKLQLIKSQTGARAYPDSPEGTQYIFETVLTVLEGEARFEHSLILELGTRLREIFELSSKDEEKLEPLYAGIFARIALKQAVTAVNDATYTKYIANARFNFDTAIKGGDKNVETHYARGQFLAITAGPNEAFEPLKTALTENPDHLRLALLFIQILSAEDKSEEALKITEMYLNKDLTPRSLLDKMALIELKKTHIGLLELVRGPEAGLNELPEFVEMVGFLFGASSESEGTNGGRAGTQGTGHHTWGRILPFRRRETFESIASSTTTPAREESTKEINVWERGIVGIAWFWIAQQYARAGLENEARESIDEARKFESSEYELAYTAMMQSILGEIESEAKPERAMEHYTLALDADPLHVSAAIGIAMLLSRQPSSESTTQRARDILNVLEASCMRYPGRYVPDAWYARGVLYEALGGPESAREMYWKTVELEERRGITRYVFLESVLGG